MSVKKKHTSWKKENRSPVIPDMKCNICIVTGNQNKKCTVLRKRLWNTRISGILLSKLEHTATRRGKGWTNLSSFSDSWQNCSVDRAIIKNVFMFSLGHPLRFSSSFNIHSQHHCYNNPETWMLMRMSVRVWNRKAVHLDLFCSPTEDEDGV